MNCLTRYLTISLAVILITPVVATAEDTPNMSSAAIVSRAWEAFNAEDYSEAIAHSEECISRYRKKALSMQAEMDGFDSDPKVIHTRWALNDVATAMFIQAESLRKLGDTDAAVDVYADLADNFSYAQCWDTKGWFWKPAEVARENLANLKKGVFYDYGDYTSQTLAVRAWNALKDKDLDAVKAYTGKLISLYSDEARSMQSALDGFAEGPKEDIFAYWALNDVGTAYYILGEANMKAGLEVDAQDAYETLVNDYSYAQCWDPQGWFWKPAAVARDVLDDLK